MNKNDMQNENENILIMKTFFKTMKIENPLTWLSKKYDNIHIFKILV